MRLVAHGGMPRDAWAVAYRTFAGGSPAGSRGTEDVTRQSGLHGRESVSDQPENAGEHTSLLSP